MSKKLFVIDAISTFRMRYVIEANNLDDAFDELTMRDSGNPDDQFDELSQKHLGEQIVDGREISPEAFNQMLVDLANSNEIASPWMGDALIRRVKYASE